MVPEKRTALVPTQGIPAETAMVIDLLARLKLRLTNQVPQPLPTSVPLLDGGEVHEAADIVLSHGPFVALPTAVSTHSSLLGRGELEHKTAARCYRLLPQLDRRDLVRVTVKLVQDARSIH